LSAIIELKKDLLKLESYTKKHWAFCSILSQKTHELEALASSISTLTPRWVESENGSLIDNDVLLFKALIEELEKNLDTIRGTCCYLNSYATEVTSELHFFLSNNALNNLFLDFLIRLNDELQALHNFLSVTETLKIAIKILCSDTLSPRVKINRNDPFGFRPLLVATALVNESASKARTAVNEFKSEEKEWQRLEQSVKSIDSIGILTPEAKQENDTSDDENHYGIEQIFKIISDWAQENLVKAIYQFDDGNGEFKFGRVSQISKFWKEQGLWQAEALIEYTMGGTQKIARNVSFQLNDSGKVVGFNLYQPVTG
jgi:hypothetical protein